MTSAASAPLGSLPCTLAAIHTIAGASAAIVAASSGVVVGSRSAADASCAAVTSAGSPTMA